MKISLTFIAIHSWLAVTTAEAKDDAIRGPNSFGLEGKSPIIPVDKSDEGSPDILVDDNLRRKLKSKVKVAKAAKAAKAGKTSKTSKKNAYVPCEIVLSSSPKVLEKVLDKPLLKKLNNMAIQAFSAGVSPAFTSISDYFTHQEVMCSIVNSVYHIHYPPTGDGFWNNEYPDECVNYFKQGNRESCNLAATAAVYSYLKPVQMISLLSRLYWQGIISTPQGITFADIPKPRKYALNLEFSPTKCNNISDTNSQCQGPAMFLFAVGMRDAMNVHMLSKDNSYEDQSRITAWPVGGSSLGASYFAETGNMVLWAEWLGMNTPFIFQGKCETASCEAMLDNLLPVELASASIYVKNYVEYKLNPVGPRPQYPGTFPKITILTNKTNTEYLLNYYYQSVHSANSTALKSICEQSDGTPVYLGVNRCLVFPDPVNNCPHVGCNEESCVQNHWIVMHTKSCEKSCTVWTYGQTLTLDCELIAAFTTTIIYGF